MDINPLESKGRLITVPHQIRWSWYTGRWWVGCYISYSEERTGWSHITVFMYNDPFCAVLMCPL